MISNTATGFGGLDIPGPTYMDGTIYWGDGAGSLHGLDLFNGGDWVWPLTASATGVGSLPTLGFVRDPASDTVDEVAYYSRKPQGGSWRSSPG